MTTKPEATPDTQVQEEANDDQFEAALESILEGDQDDGEDGDSDLDDC